MGAAAAPENKLHEKYVLKISRKLLTEKRPYYIIGDALWEMALDPLRGVAQLG